jgi:hypothetical protein
MQDSIVRKSAWIALRDSDEVLALYRSLYSDPDLFILRLSLSRRQFISSRRIARLDDYRCKKCCEGLFLLLVAA